MDFVHDLSTSSDVFLNETGLNETKSPSIGLDSLWLRMKEVFLETYTIRDLVTTYLIYSSKPLF